DKGKWQRNFSSERNRWDNIAEKRGRQFIIFISPIRNVYGQKQRQELELDHVEGMHVSVDHSQSRTALLAYPARTRRRTSKANGSERLTPYSWARAGIGQKVVEPRTSRPCSKRTSCSTSPARRGAGSGA